MNQIFYGVFFIILSLFTLVYGSFNYVRTEKTRDAVITVIMTLIMFWYGVGMIVYGIWFS